MEELSAKTRESCSIATLDLPDIVYVARVPTSRIMTVALGVGARLPAYATSMGRVLLAGPRRRRAHRVPLDVRGRAADRPHGHVSGRTPRRIDRGPLPTATPWSTRNSSSACAPSPPRSATPEAELSPPSTSPPTPPAPPRPPSAPTSSRTSDSRRPDNHSPNPPRPPLNAPLPPTHSRRRRSAATTSGRVIADRRPHRPPSSATPRELPHRATARAIPSAQPTAACVARDSDRSRRPAPSPLGRMSTEVQAGSAPGRRGSRGSAGCS